MKKRLLLIDDHALFRSGIAMVLNAGLTGVEIFESASMEQAMHCSCKDIDLLLLDVQLEGLNGLDGIALLKRKWPRVKILVVSASQDTQIACETLRRGAHGFISKAETPVHMLQKVTQILSGDTTVREIKNTTTESNNNSARLTPRQCEVLDLLCQGLSNKMIGRRLNLSENTVRGHVQAILQALQVSNRSEAAFVARHLGLVN